MPQRPRASTTIQETQNSEEQAGANGASTSRRIPEKEKGEAERLFLAWSESQDPELRERLICQHLYLVQAVARKFTGLGESSEDLISEGMMGLINAVDLFDPSRGVQFSTYATHLVDGQIRHYLRDKSKMIREPAWIQERLTRITRAAESITHQMGRPARLAEIAKAVDLSENQVREALTAQERSRVASLDGGRSTENEEGDASEGLSRLLSDTDSLPGMAVEDRIFLQQAMKNLKALEQQVLHHFYYLDLNQSEIARKLGISVNYASYLLRGALSKLKQAFETQAKTKIEVGPTPQQWSREAMTVYSLQNRTQSVAAEPLTSEGYFRQTLAHEVARSNRYGHQFALVIIEPDSAADWDDDKRSSVMRELYNRVQSSVRMVDVVSRIGRWRLGVLLPQTGRESTLVAERLRQRACEHYPISLGLAVFPSDSAHDAGLEEHAIRSLQHAQETGGNQVVRLEPVPVPSPPEPKPKRTRRKKTDQTKNS
jgi:RNA polymerase sigma-B factor